MTNISTTDVQSRTIAAFFDTREAAQTATTDLVAAGIPREFIRLTEGGSKTNATGAASAANEKGFWDELKDLFLPDEDRYGYAEGLRRGGYLLSVKVEEAYYTRAMDILDRDGAVNLDEREASWRSEGWSGYQSSASTGSGYGSETRTASSLSSGVGLGAGATASALAGSAATARSSSTQVDTLQSGKDEVIPVYEETAQVGKRDVNHGRVRLRSYVVETPIREQVNLRSEQVQVERRPVDRPIGAGDAVFKDRVIEAEEHAEEAFITKETRVKEEIALRKTVESQNQTLSDTVRRTEVEIEDGRTDRALATGQRFVAGRDSASITEHMDVIAADGVKIGTVDHLDGDNIKLARNTSADGEHHYVPLAWIDHVDTHVHLSKPSTEAKASW